VWNCKDFLSLILVYVSQIRITKNRDWRQWQTNVFYFDPEALVRESSSLQVLTSKFTLNEYFVPCLHNPFFLGSCSNY